MKKSISATNKERNKSHLPGAVLVTGASSGIGQATALLFAQMGYQVHLLGRNKKALLETQKHCHAISPQAKISHHSWVCDLAIPTQVNKTVDAILKNQEHPLRILINNAGIFDRHSFEDPKSLKIWHEQFSVNLMGAVHITQPIFSHFKQNKEGSIVNISSTLGLKTSPGVSAYAAIKAAMINWTQSLALEGGKWGIRANCVCPGIVDTPIHSFHQQTPAQKKVALASYNSLQPLGRIGEASEVAETIYFLASPLSSWTTGAVVAVDGGINL
jgi:NAD(P)-dependent dehydrogenase (short-subunit alcohol dehydrogenase family)